MIRESRPTGATGAILRALTNIRVGYGQGAEEREERDREQEAETRAQAAKAALERRTRERQDRQDSLAERRERRSAEAHSMSMERQREDRAMDFARRHVEAAGGDVRRARDEVERSEMGTARRLGLRRTHYFAAEEALKRAAARRGTGAGVDQLVAQALEGDDAPDMAAPAAPIAAAPAVATDPRQQALQLLEQQYREALEAGVDPDAALAIYEREKRRILGGA